MEQNTHTCQITLDWDLLNAINKVERFDATWAAIEKKEKQSLQQLKNLALVKSVGAAARIKGAYLNDLDVELLLKKKNRYILKDEFSQEALGYYEVLKNILDKINELELAEFNIKNFHNNLLKYSESDHWKRGHYRLAIKPISTDSTSSTNKGGFKTTRPTFEMENLMRDLLLWFQQKSIVHPLVKCAVFVYEFLAIKPFDKGTERLARILASFLLIKANYKWMQYVSLEHEIEIRKTEYDRILRRCQAAQPNENISSWVLFFLDVLSDLQLQLLQRLKMAGTTAQLPPKHKAILLYVETHPGCRSGHVATRLGIANSTAKRMLSELLNQGLIKRYGKGAGTNYTIS